MRALLVGVAAVGGLFLIVHILDITDVVPKGEGGWLLGVFGLLIVFAILFILDKVIILKHKAVAHKHQFKECQYCGERIKAVAIKCKHCGSELPQ